MMEYQNNQDLMAQLKSCCKQMIQALETYENHPDRQCLKEIQSAIKNKELEDFDTVEEIVYIMLEYGWERGVRHDSG